MTTLKGVFRVQGMICRQCEDIIETSLLHTKGVIKADASYWKGNVSVEYDPEIVSAADIGKALALTGYPPGEKGLSGILIDVICAVCVLVVFFLLPVLKSVDIPEASDGATFGFIFLIGLLTSTHCVAMCGGIMLSQTAGKTIAVGASKKRSKYGLLSSLYYNGGRVFSYTLTGAVFGALGSVVSYTAATKSMVFTIAGALVLLVGIQMWGIIPGLRKLSFQLPSFCDLPGSVRRRFYGRPLIIGLLTGIMPCGPLSAMWIYAMGTGDAVSGALSMLVFALGTVPLMYIFGAINSFVPQKYNKYMIKASSVLITSMGLAMLLKGIELLGK